MGKVSPLIRKVRISYCMVDGDGVCNIHSNRAKLKNTCHISEKYEKGVCEFL